MAEIDITERVERLDAFEARAQVRIEAISAFWDPETQIVQVNGELHPVEGGTIGLDLELEMMVYDGRQRLVAKALERVPREGFFGFHAFSLLENVPDPVREVSRIRLVPRPSAFQSDPDDESEVEDEIGEDRDD